MFDFFEWLKTALPLAGALVPLNMAVAQFSEKIGAAGNVQLLVAGIGGFALGILGDIAFFGVPADFRGWFLAVLLGVMVFGGSVGTYEAIKSAASKAQE